MLLPTLTFKFNNIRAIDSNVKSNHIKSVLLNINLIRCTPVRRRRHMRVYSAILGRYVYSILCRALIIILFVYCNFSCVLDVFILEYLY